MEHLYNEDDKNKLIDIPLIMLVISIHQFQELRLYSASNLDSKLSGR